MPPVSPLSAQLELEDVVVTTLPTDSGHKLAVVLAHVLFPPSRFRYQQVRFQHRHGLLNVDRLRQVDLRVSLGHAPGCSEQRLPGAVSSEGRH